MNRKLFILLLTFILLDLNLKAERAVSKNHNTSIIGEWVTVDFVLTINHFDPAERNYQDDFSLKGLSFEDDGTAWWFYADNFCRKLKWEPGKAQTMDDHPALYEIRSIEGNDYLFIEWISGDVIHRGMKPRYYVLKKGPVKNQYSDSPQNSRSSFTTVQPVDKVDPFDDVRYKDLSKLQGLSNTLVQGLRFNQDTVWPEQAVGNKTIDWFADKILESAMNPGLGVRILHKMGITGKGVNVAIIDQPLYQDHPEFKGKIAAYYDVGCGSESSMHGPAVASLLVGGNCGTAPDTRLYYVAAPSWTKDTGFQAQALEWIIEQNHQLPTDQKIRLVSVSGAPSGPGSPFDKNTEMWDTTCQKAETEGIMVLDCTQHHGFIAGCFFEDRNVENPTFCRPGSPSSPWTGMIPSEKLFVPTCPRTTAEEYDEGTFTYAYWGQGGLSWAIPYAAGVLAMGWQVWPEATSEQMRELLFQSAYTNKDGAKIINPPQFINAVKKAQKVRIP